MKRFFSNLFNKVTEYKNNEKGMTLLELLAAILILGIIAAITVPAFTNQGDDARVKAHESNINTIEQAAERFNLDKGLVDTDFVPITSKHELVTSGYLKEVPTNPWASTREALGGTKYQYAITKDSRGLIHAFLIEYSATYTDVNATNKASAVGTITGFAEKNAGKYVRTAHAAGAKFQAATPTDDAKRFHF